MTLTSQYDPSRPEHKVTCSRTKCVERPAHPAGLHLDQRSEFYDGPDIQLTAASLYIRPSARKIIAEAPELMPEVVDLVTYVEFLEDQATHARVDRDRGIWEASKRALDCDAHGEVIRGLEAQLTGLDSSGRKSEAGRRALLGFLTAVDQFTGRYRKDESQDPALEPVVDALERMSKSTHAAHTRAWSR